MYGKPIAPLALVVAASLCAVHAYGAEAPPLQVTSVRPEKILYDEKAPVHGSVTVKNTAKEDKTVTVRAWLEWELDKATPAQETQLAVSAGQSATAAFDWPQAPEKFGHALKAEVRFMMRSSPAAKTTSLSATTTGTWR